MIKEKWTDNTGRVRTSENVFEHVTQREMNEKKVKNEENGIDPQENTWWIRYLYL